MNALDMLLEELESQIEGSATSQLEEDLGHAIDEAMNQLEESLKVEALEEANKVKFDRKTKLKAAVTKKAILMAKQAGDGIYEKHERARKMWKKTEAILVKKYGVKAKAEVRKALTAKK